MGASIDGHSRMESESHGDLLARLVAESRSFESSSKDAERNCWLVVHRHAHGVLPSEYDIREIPEDLYLEVLALHRQQA